MNFLALCQRVAKESGTISGILPLTTANQNGRLSKIVSWTSEAWTRIQNHRPGGWNWMRAEFAGLLMPGEARYEAAAWTLPRFASWMGDTPDYSPMSLYDTARGAADEGAIRQVAWETWRTRYGRGQQPRGRPICYAHAPDGRIALGPVPDLAYCFNGEYYRSAQILAADTDVPDFPERFHMIIVWHALMLLHMHDEGVQNIGFAQISYDQYLRDLDLSQTPPISIGGGASIA